MTNETWFGLDAPDADFRNPGIRRLPPDRVRLRHTVTVGREGRLIERDPTDIGHSMIHDMPSSLNFLKTLEIFFWGCIF